MKFLVFNLAVIGAIGFLVLHNIYTTESVTAKSM